MLKAQNNKHCAGMTLPISFPDGFLFITPPGTAPSTTYDGGANAWTTFATVPLGATSLSTLSFITASATQLTSTTQVRRLREVIVKAR